MKTMILSAFATLCCFGSFAQPYAFDDAIKLRGLINPATGKFENRYWDSIKTILTPYLKGNEDLREFTEKNPLFQHMLHDNNREMVYSTNPIESKRKDFYSSIGGLDVTNLADGLARFLVKRTKEELSVAFFDKFRKTLTQKNYRDAVTLFPETCHMLTDIGENIYMYQAFLPALQEAFQKDLRLLTDNLPKVINDGRYAVFFHRHQLLKYTCLSGIYITDGIVNEVHPGKIIEDFPVEYMDSIKNERYPAFDQHAIKDVSATMKIFQLISTSFKAQSDSNYWVSAGEVKDAFADPITVKIYLSLIAKQARHISFAQIENRERSMYAIFKNLADNYDKHHKEYAAFCTQLITKGETVHKYILEAEELLHENQNPSFEIYYKYFNGVIDLFEQAGRFTDLPFVKDNTMGGFDSTFSNYIHICRRTSDLALNLKQKNYSTAVIDAFSIYTFAFNRTVVEYDKKIDSLVGPEKENILNTQKFAPELLRLGTFIASVAEAKTSEEVSNAIEAAALPAGSSRIKRESKGNIALNAYLGPFIGYEHIDGVDDDFKFNSYGLLAPVGVSASLGQFYSIFSGKHTSSVSLFLSAIDLGAVAAFRFQDDETSQIPTITLRELIAPGAFLVYGFGKTPISFGAGWQIGPRLRNVTATDNSVSEMYSRFSLSFTVDIPLLNFATWPGDR